MMCAMMCAMMRAMMRAMMFSKRLLEGLKLCLHVRRVTFTVLDVDHG
jgi:hypothetical protein